VHRGQKCTVQRGDSSFEMALDEGEESRRPTLEMLLLASMRIWSRSLWSIILFCDYFLSEVPIEDDALDVSPDIDHLLLAIQGVQDTAAVKALNRNNYTACSNR
jgi:hypothetical protein